MYESVLQSLHAITFCVVIFIQNEITTKAACKIFVKLAPDLQHPEEFGEKEVGESIHEVPVTKLDL